MPVTSLGLQADKKEESNIPATPTTSVMCCSSESVPTLCLSPGRVCLRAMMSILYRSKFPRRVYLICYLYMLEKIKAKYKI